MSDALTPPIEQWATDSDGRFDACGARIDEMSERFLRDMMIRFGRMRFAETAVIMAALRFMPCP